MRFPASPRPAPPSRVMEPGSASLKIIGEDFWDWPARRRPEEGPVVLSFAPSRKPLGAWNSVEIVSNTRNARVVRVEPLD